MAWLLTAAPHSCSTCFFPLQPNVISQLTPVKEIAGSLNGLDRCGLRGILPAHPAAVGFVIRFWFIGSRLLLPTSLAPPPRDEPLVLLFIKFFLTHERFIAAAEGGCAPQRFSFWLRLCRAVLHFPSSGCEEDFQPRKLSNMLGT